MQPTPERKKTIQNLLRKAENDGLGRDYWSKYYVEHVAHETQMHPDTAYQEYLYIHRNIEEDHKQRNKTSFYETIQTLRYKEYVEEPQMLKYRPLELYGFYKGKDLYKKLTEILSLEFRHLHPVITPRTPSTDTPELYVYIDGVYVRGAQSYIEEYCREQLREKYTKRIARNVTEKIIADTYTDPKQFFKPQKNHICVENGIYNIETKELEPHTPEKVFFQKIPHKYNENASIQEVKKFFEDVLPKPEDIVVIQEMFGYSLTQNHFIAKAFMLLGEGGNGKGQTITLLRKLLGDDNYSSVSLQSLLENRFKAAQLQHRLANISGDLSPKALRNTGLFKAVTGGDSISAERKNQPSFEFESYATQIFACNELPRTHDTTTAFARRWALIEFPFSFKDPSEYDENNPLHKKKVPRIAEKITDKNEMEGLLKWSLEGLHRVIKNDEFSTTQTTEELMQYWIAKTDSLQAFLMECVTTDTNTIITKEHMRDAYYLWAKKKGYEANRSTKHHANTIRSFFAVGDTQKRIEGKVTRCWKGLAFKDDYEAVRIGERSIFNHLQDEFQEVTEEDIKEIHDNTKQAKQGENQ
jgi:P4 family phage/plasmid primase-like protien